MRAWLPGREADTHRRGVWTKTHRRGNKSHSVSVIQFWKLSSRGRGNGERLRQRQSSLMWIGSQITHWHKNNPWPPQPLPIPFVFKIPAAPSSSTVDSWNDSPTSPSSPFDNPITQCFYQSLELHAFTGTLYSQRERERGRAWEREKGGKNGFEKSCRDPVRWAILSLWGPVEVSTGPTTVRPLFALWVAGNTRCSRSDSEWHQVFG